MAYLCGVAILAERSPRQPRLDLDRKDNFLDQCIEKTQCEGSRETVERSACRH